MGIATAVSLFFGLLSPFGSDVIPLVKRLVLIVTYGWIGSLLGLFTTRLAWRLGLWPRVWVAGLATGVMMVPPMAVVVLIGATLSNGHAPPRTALPEMLWDTALICIAMSFLAVVFARRGSRLAERAPGPPRFLDRLPLKLRGAEVWAVEAEDHYLRLHTSKGQDLVLMRLSDAIEELEGIEGAQVHRSWWVARDAITEAVRGDGRATLTLKDGAEVPVSRTYARLLRERGWV